MELAPYHPSGACNFEVGPTFMGYMWMYFCVRTPAVNDTPASYSKASNLNMDTVHPLKM